MILHGDAWHGHCIVIAMLSSFGSSLNSLLTLVKSNNLRENPEFSDKSLTLHCNALVDSKLENKQY